jgi:hypothetical protein
MIPLSTAGFASATMAARLNPTHNSMENFLMSWKRFLLPAAALLMVSAAFLIFRQPSAAQEKLANGSTAWEYKNVYFRWGRTEKTDRPQLSIEKMEEIMNELGAKGWELSGTIGDVAGDTDTKLRTATTTNLILIFKRPKR